MPEETKTAEEKKKPVHTIMHGHVRASIWENKSANPGVWYSFTVERVYLDDKDGKWHYAGGFNAEDAVHLAKASDLVDDWIRLQKQKQK